MVRRGLDSAEKLRNYYDKVRLAILAGVLRTTPDGYRAGGARFLIGAIYWRQGRAAEALQIWRNITVDPDDTYARVCRELLDAITSDRTVGRSPFRPQTLCAPSTAAGSCSRSTGCDSSDTTSTRSNAHAAA
jgi:hypothetical protein